jgi:hypothetical protein
MYMRYRYFMIKRIFIGLFIFFVSLVNEAGAVSYGACVSYYRPNSSVLRQIYGSSWLDVKFKVEQSVSRHSETWSKLKVFTAVDFLLKGGKSLGGCYDTDIQIVPVSLGLEWVQPIISQVLVYFELAPKYYFLSVEDYNSAGSNTMHKNGLGGYVGAGFRFKANQKVFFDLFAGYSFVKLGKDDTTGLIQSYALQAGGLNIGGGVFVGF